MRKRHGSVGRIESAQRALRWHSKRCWQYDDISLAELMHPSLTTVRQNTQQAAKEMVTQLLNQFENKPTESQVVETT